MSTRRSFLSSLTDNVTKFTTNTINEATKAKEKFFEGQTQAEQLSFGPLWEIPESADFCRECNAKLQFLKHHCRSCGGVFCDDCCPSSPPNAFERSIIPKAMNITASDQVRLCLGCKRGEGPGLSIKTKIKDQLEEEMTKSSRSTVVKIEKFQQKVAAKLEEVVNKMGDVYQENSHYCLLKRGSFYGENNMMKKSGSKPVAISGYFEIYNKSTEFFAMKLLKISNNDYSSIRFEIARPSYIVIPPGEALYAFFHPEEDRLALITLHTNPNPTPTDSSVIYDTKAHGAIPSRLSLCARMDLFERVTVYGIDSIGKNVLLKYKGNGIIHPREGTSMERVGIFGYFQGKRHADGKLDYQTNIHTLAPLFSLS